MKTVAFVPIRLNSKRVAGKNLKELNGKPLLCYILETLVKVEKIDKVYVYCSNPDIKKFLPQGVEFLQRPIELDSDDTLGEDIYDAFTKTVDADIYVLAHTTSPFIKHATIENALEHVTSGEYDSAFSVEKIQTFTWFKGQPLNYDLKNIPRTQTIEPIYVETSAFFIFKSEIWKEHHQRIGFKPYFAEIDKIEGVDIDWPADFNFAEKIVKTLK
ncbi:MAG: acylneuraminate cytidylyltransferase family protein [Paludibacteraceae bacterium]|nr:acylneuraminate cytidylyltransferase family protein [Paludibacteraceae bacterium]MBO7337644.1 acylneuraminate cytidylyltransferase family protein [Paludibacteraceae bacterium]MBP5742246.1 acylneuraminate cytidylyltransferase family protein [Paludibacteraceae bacterium]